MADEVTKADEVAKDTSTAKTAKKAKVRYEYTFRFKSCENPTLEDIQCAKGAIRHLVATQRNHKLLYVYEIIRNKKGALVHKRIEKAALEELLENYTPPVEPECYVE